MTEFKKGFSIAMNVIYCLTTIALITYYKDVIYAMIFVIIEVGYISKSALLTKGELITAIVLLSFIFISIVTSIFKYGKLSFGYERDEDMDNLLEKHKIKHKRSEEL